MTVKKKKNLGAGMKPRGIARKRIAESNAKKLKDMEVSVVEVQNEGPVEPKIQGPAVVVNTDSLGAGSLQNMESPDLREESGSVEPSTKNEPESPEIVAPVLADEGRSNGDDGDTLADLMKRSMETQKSVQVGGLGGKTPEVDPVGGQTETDPRLDQAKQQGRNVPPLLVATFKKPEAFNLKPENTKMQYEPILPDTIHGGDFAFSKDVAAIQRFFPLGEQPDGTFAIVVNVPEGMIAGIQQQAESDKVTPEEWLTTRMIEYLESWWSPPQGR